MKVSVDGGAPQTVLRAEVVPGATFLDWADDGTIVFLSFTGLSRVPEGGGDPERLMAPQPGHTFNFPRALPGGRGVLLTDVQAASLWLLDLQADSLRMLIPEGLDALYASTGHFLYLHPEGGLVAAPFDVETMRVTGQPIPRPVSAWAPLTR